jgi:glycogen operon protein
VSVLTQSAYKTAAGRAHPLGATVTPEGVNFSVYSEHATAMELLLFDDPLSPQPSAVIPLSIDENSTFHFWHVFIHGLRPGTGYAFRVHGPSDAQSLQRDGTRFDPAKVLLDPYARAVETRLWDRGAACREGDNVERSLRGVVVDVDDYDWQGDHAPGNSLSESVIYELHVGGFTRAADVQAPGTFRGVIERIPYLVDLGVTAVELMPATQFDPTDVGGVNPLTGQPLSNYWGYSPVAYFAPHSAYCTSQNAAGYVTEFRDMVKALHQAGIEVILDVVFNHTAEGNHLGPMMSFKGIDNPLYYYTVNGDRQYYMDYSGCGNTLNCNHPIVNKLILDSLTYWVQQMHVDGFRFDEGSVLTRGEDGAPMAHPPVIWNIELSEALLDTKVLAEAWDAAGLYQVGHFPGPRWGEWNGRFRDTIRRFVAGTPGILGEVASRMAGSSDLYQRSDREPVNSLNFITCHDGFTLEDLVSYDGKHNEANGEGNRDGINDNLSWNCGAEGPTDDRAIAQLRSRQVRNFLTLLMVSQGVPMLTMGDEIRRTQQGNNNAYCQDNPTTWMNWAGLTRQADTLAFTRGLIALRREHPALHRNRFFDGQVNGRGMKDLSWHGSKLNTPGWDDPSGQLLAFTLGAVDDVASDVHVIANMSDQPIDVELPELIQRRWHRAVDTALPPGEDLARPGTEPVVPGPGYRIDRHSIAVLVSYDDQW